MPNTIDIENGGYLNGNGYYYRFGIAYTDAKSKNVYTIPNTVVSRFEWYMRLNKFDIDGVLDIVDTTSNISTLFKQKFVSFTVTLTRYSQAKNDGNTNIERKYVEDWKFQHDFILDRFEILNKEGNVYTYRLYLVSLHSLKLNSIIHTTTWGLEKDKNDEKDIVTIIKNCAKMCGMKFFDYNKDVKILSGVKLDYCTSSNDNFYSIFDYLSKRLYFYQKNALKKLIFFYYNPFNDSIQLMDLSNLETIKGDNMPMVISSVESGIETIATTDKLNFAVLNKLPIQQIVQSLYPVKRYDFDLWNNSFNEDIVTSQDIINYSNSSFLKGKEDEISSTYKVNTEGLGDLDVGNNEKFNPTQSTREYGYWNDMPSIYEEQMKYMLEKNAIVVNCQGNITRTPGTMVTIQKNNINAKTDVNSVENMKNAYSEYSGDWIVESVRSIFNPTSGNQIFELFRQNLVMFRNVVSYVKPKQ